MILYSVQGMSNDDIANCLDTRREVVSLWRKRFFTDRLAGLEERDRPGRPRTFPQNSWYKLRPSPASAGEVRLAFIVLAHSGSGSASPTQWPGGVHQRQYVVAVVA